MFIIDTPRGSRNKLKWDKTLGVLKLRHILTAGAVFPLAEGPENPALASEYRALRASVLRLWNESCQPDDINLEDVIRFNEAIDQALAESIGFFSEQVERARNLLLGMLGHD